MRRWVFAGVCVAGVCSIVAESGPDKLDVEQADMLMAEGLYERARYVLTGLLGQDKEPWRIRERLAEAEVGSGDGRGGLRAFAAALNGFPEPAFHIESDSRAAGILRAIRLLRMREFYSVASPLLDAAAAKWPSYAGVYYEKAYLASNQGDLPGFLRHYSDGYWRDPDSPLSLFGKCIVFDAVGTSIGEPPDPWPSLPVELLNQHDSVIAWQTLVSRQIRALGKAEAFNAAKGLSPSAKAAYLAEYYRQTNQREQAVAAARGLLGMPEQEMMGRRMLLALGERDEALRNLPPPPGDALAQVSYYEFLAKSHTGIPLQDSGRHCIDALVRAAASVCSELDLGPAEMRRPIAILQRSLARERIAAGDYRGAVHVLAGSSSNPGIPDARPATSPSKGLARPDAVLQNLHLAVGILIQLEDYDNAIRLMERVLPNTHGDERAHLASRLADHAMLCGKTEVIRQLADECPEFKRLLQSLEDRGKRSYRITDVQPHLECEDMKWWEMDSIGPCARVATWSVLRHFGDTRTLSDVSRSLSDQEGMLSNPLAAMQEVMRSSGFNVLWCAPRREVAVSLLSKGIPVVLVHEKYMQGFMIGHVSVVYGADDHVEKLYLRDISGEGETRIGYDDLQDAWAMVVVLPPGDKTKAEADITKYLIPSPDAVVGRLDYMAKDDLSQQYWLFRHNIIVKMRSGRLEELMDDIRRLPSGKHDPYLVEMLGKYYCATKRGAEALAVVEEAKNAVRPTIPLLRMEIELKRERLGDNEGGRGDSKLQELLEKTRRMEAMNPEYPHTYFLRADLYAREHEWERALVAFRAYMARYKVIDRKWREHNVAFMEHAQRSIKLLKRTLEKKYSRGAEREATSRESAEGLVGSVRNLGRPWRGYGVSVAFSE